MNKYLIQYSIEKYNNNLKHWIYIKQSPVVRNFTDKELEDFCKNKKKVKVTFLCKLE